MFGSKGDRNVSTHRDPCLFLWAVGLIPCGILSQTAEPNLSGSPKYLHVLTNALIQQQPHWGHGTLSSHKAHGDVRRQLCAHCEWFFSVLPSGHVGHLKLPWTRLGTVEQLETLRDGAHMSKTCSQLGLFYSQSYDSTSAVNLFSWRLVNYVTLAAQSECRPSHPFRQL